MTIDTCKPLSQNEIIEHLWKTLSIITYSTKWEKNNDIIWFFYVPITASWDKTIAREW